MNEQSGEKAVSPVIKKAGILNCNLRSKFHQKPQFHLSLSHRSITVLYTPLLVKQSQKSEFPWSPHRIFLYRDISDLGRTPPNCEHL